MSVEAPLHEGQVLSGPLFSEPMRVETVRANGADVWELGLAGTRTERYRRVTLTREDLGSLAIADTGFGYTGDGRLLRLGLQAYSLGIAYEFDPFFGLSISRVDPLPHQLEAVYDHLLKLARVRFLLADDAGAGKTVMAGLLIRELKLRGLAERILVVCPANLAFQWQRELKEKFDETFLVLKGGDLRDQFGVNQWLEQPHVITSLDLAKRSEILPGLAQVRWDLVIVDEAHRMSWTPPARKTGRYALGELLRDTADHLLLLTATPHKGDPGNFSLFLQLLDADAYADVKSIREAMERRRAPFYLRRTKEAMVHFPERKPDGTWAAEKIFTRRIPHTVAFEMDGPEHDLYKEVTRFVKRQSTKAAERGDDPRARAVGFLMSLYQRRLASSTHALRKSLENRARRLEEGLKQAEALARAAPADLPGPDEVEEMEEGERERLERMLEAVTLAGNAEQVREEVAELRQLAMQARAVEATGTEAKLARLEDLLRNEGFFDRPDKRLLVFTEFRDTLDHLVGRLKDWGFAVGSIHGGMKPGSRDEPGTRLHSEQRFREGAIQVLVATEAAGEGINLQVCNVLFNYDIPWNPNRLEQRMGRIHRYGQREDCLIFNFAATNTIEGQVLRRLLDKLQEIRDALDDDAVFNVVGEVLPAAHVERILRDYYAGKLGDTDLEERLLESVDEGRFRNICRNALEGLASKKLNLDMLIERRARAQERRVVPETIARFLAEAARYVPFKLVWSKTVSHPPAAPAGDDRDSAQRNRQAPAPAVANHAGGLRTHQRSPLKAAGSAPHTFEPGRTPAVLRRYERDPDWKLPALAGRYPRCSTDRETAEKHALEWVTPGHPLFEAVRRHTCAEGGRRVRHGRFLPLLAARPSGPDRLLPGAHRGRPGADGPRTPLRGGDGPSGRPASSGAGPHRKLRAGGGAGGAARGGDRARTRRLAAPARPGALPRRHPAGAADGDRAGRLARRAFPDRAAAARRRGDRQGGRRPGPGRAGGGRAAGPGGASARRAAGPAGTPRPGARRAALADPARRGAPDQRAGPPASRARGAGSAPHAAEPGNRGHGHAGGDGARAGAGPAGLRREREEPGLRRDQPGPRLRGAAPRRGQGPRGRHRDDPPHPQRTARGRRPPRLLLALRRHRLRRRSDAPGPHPRPGPLRLERGDQGRALLPVGQRADPADAGAGGRAIVRGRRMSPLTAERLGALAAGGSVPRSLRRLRPRRNRRLSRQPKQRRRPRLAVGRSRCA